MTWANTDPSHPFTTSYLSVSTDVLVVPMTCSGDCLTSATHDPAVSGSGASATGGIFNYLQLTDSARNYFIRFGYGAIGGDGASTYFVDYRFPILNDADGSITPGYRRVILPSTGIPPVPSGGYPFARLQILGGSGQDGGVGLTWYACLSLPATSGRSPFQTPMCTRISFAYLDAVALDLPDADSFVPNAFSLGEHVYGTSGASAVYATFTNTRYSHVQAIGYEDGTGAQLPTCEDGTDCNWHLVGNDWALQASTPAAVPFANWLITPARSPSNGGMFSVECCRPVHS